MGNCVSIDHLGLWVQMRFLEFEETKSKEVSSSKELKKSSFYFNFEYVAFNNKDLGRNILRK